MRDDDQDYLGNQSGSGQSGSGSRSRNDDRTDKRDYNSGCHGGSGAPKSGPDGRDCDQAGRPSGPEPTVPPDPYNNPFAR